MTALEAAAEAMPDRQIDWADFDRMLGDMPSELGAQSPDFFGFAADARAHRGDRHRAADEPLLEGARI